VFAIILLSGLIFGSTYALGTICLNKQWSKNGLRSYQTSMERLGKCKTLTRVNSGLS